MEVQFHEASFYENARHMHGHPDARSNAGAGGNGAYYESQGQRSQRAESERQGHQ